MDGIDLLNDAKWRVVLMQLDALYRRTTPGYLEGWEARGVITSPEWQANARFFRSVKHLWPEVMTGIALMTKKVEKQQIEIKLLRKELKRLKGEVE